MKAREAAVRALLACETRGAWSDAYLNGLFERESPDRREAALAYRICAGVLQNREACDWYLKPYLKGKLQNVIRAILRSAVYQIAFMDRIPTSAAVNEAVEMAKKLGNPGAARMVNAVLRRLTAQELPPLPEGNDTNSLSVRFSHPGPWIDYFMDLLGPEKTEALLACNNLPAPLTLRANLLKTDLGQAAEALRAEGLEIKPLAMNGFFSVENQGDITSLKAFQDGLVTVQDPAAALPVYAASAQPGINVLDCCAAPGGKSFLLAQEMQDQGSILSCDLHGNKLRRIEEGAQRLGIHIIETCAMDASRPLNAMKERFDLVLADVPCSGMGVIRKKPEIRYKTREQTAPLPKTQLAILEGAADCLRPGGVLVYSTCTLLREENESVTDAFLDLHPEFHREALTLPEPFGEAGDGQKTIWPFEYETDGFYLCRMRKKI